MTRNPEASADIPSAGVPIAAYCESFIAGRRVVVFGSARSALAQHLLDRGARFVHVYDPTSPNVSTAEQGVARQLRYSPLTQADAELQGVSFDFGVIENLNQCPDPKRCLELMTRAVSPRGAAVVGVPSPQAPLQPSLMAASSAQGAALGYYELYDHVAEHFADVRMLGQLPFAGYAIADFSAEREADVSVDTAFMPGGAEEPQWFWALCSHEPVVGEAFSIIQLPLAGLAGLPQPSALQTADDQSEKEQVAALEAAVKERDARLAQASAQRATAEASAAELKTQLEQLRAKPPAGEKSDDAAAEIANLERLLSERAAVVQRLEQQLVEAEKVVGDLVRELDASRQNQKPLLQAVDLVKPIPEAAELKARLDNLALANAERAALLATAEATIRELEHKLSSVAAKEQLQLAASEIQRQATSIVQEQAKDTTELPS